MRAAMQSKAFKAFFYIAFLFFGVYFLFSVLPQTLFSDDLQVESISSYTYDRTVNGSGIALKYETKIYAPEAYDYIDYQVDDGSRTGKDSIVAECTRAELTEEDIRDITELKRKISQLQTTFQSDILVSAYELDDDAKEQIVNYMDSLWNADYAAASDYSDLIQILFNRKDIKLNGPEDYEQQLQSLQEELNALYTSLSAHNFDVSTDYAGYFYSGYDGYEDLRFEDWAKNDVISVEKFDELMAVQPTSLDDGYVGKIQDTPTWYFAAEFNTADVIDISVGKSLDLEFNIPGVGTKKIPFRLVSKSADSQGRTIAVLMCEILTNFEFEIRKADCRLITTTYSGLKVSNDALRVVDGQEGVYVLVGQKIVFKPVEVIYSSEDFTLVSASSATGSRTLKENDEVVVGGKDLFDGKVVNVG